MFKKVISLISVNSICKFQGSQWPGVVSLVTKISEVEQLGSNWT